MAEPLNIWLRYDGLNMRFCVPEQMAPALRSELEPFFAFTTEQISVAQPFVSLNIHLSEFDKSEIPQASPTKVKVDSSLYKHLASEGKRWGDEIKYIILIEISQTWVVFDRKNLQVDLYQADMPRCVTESIRVIKSLFTPALELSGAIQLHGSAVATKDGCVLLLGDMWHGKTTLLLEMLAQFNVAELSCDTVVLSPSSQGGITVSGWPSPFSVSHGTIADFPELYSSFPAERSKTPYGQLWRERKKTVLTSGEVVKRFHTTLTPQATQVQVCLLITFAPEQPTQIQQVSSVDTLTQSLHTVCLGSRDPIYHNWHRFFTCPDDLLSASLGRWAERLLQTRQVYAMTWAPSAVSLMKRVPALARLHKHLPNILDFSEAPEDNG